MQHLFNDIVSFTTTVLVIVVGIVIQRLFNRHDEKLEEIKEAENKRLQEARKAEEEHKKEAEQQKEWQRRIERRVNQHTRSLTALAKANKITGDTVAEHGSEIEDLADATEALQIATENNRKRIEKSEEYITQMRMMRHERMD